MTAYENADVTAFEKAEQAIEESRDERISEGEAALRAVALSNLAVAEAITEAADRLIAHIADAKGSAPPEGE